MKNDSSSCEERQGQQGAWCTINEFRKVNLAAREMALRTLQKKANEGLLPVPMKRILHPNGKSYTYLLNITDPKEIKRLIAYRTVKNVQKSNPARPNTQAADLSTEIPGNNKKSPLLRLSIRVPADSLVDIAMNTPLIRKTFIQQLNHIAKTAKEAGFDKTPQTRKKRYDIRIKRETRNYIQKYAKDMSMTENAAFISLFMECLHSDPRVKAAIIASNMARNNNL